MMQADFLCASANITEIDPLGADFPIIRERIDNASTNVIMSNSFGFGGTNATLVFRRFNG
jgi:3-oxoacyl-[acyl-carrier-protein] synthase I